LNSTPVQSREEAKVKNQAHRQEVVERMMSDGHTYGASSGGLPWFEGANPQERLQAVNDDLPAQIDMVGHILDHWFRYGDPVPCHYPNRIAIILRKMGRGDLETDFLWAFGRHFISHCGGAAHARFNERIRKVIGAQEAEKLLAAFPSG